jgi:two-component system response regulator YesN
MTLKAKQGSSVRLSWLLSYLAVLLVPLAICAMLLSFQNEELLAESAKANEAILIQTQVLYDDIFCEAVDFSQEIVLQTRLASGKTRVTDSYGLYQYRMYHLQQQLNSLLVVNRYLEDYFVFLKDGTVLTSTAILSDDYAEISLLAKDFPYEQYQQYAQMQTQAAFTTMQWGGSPRIVYYTPFHDAMVGMPEGSVMLVFNSARVADSLGTSSEWDSDGYMLILDEQKRILAGNQTPSDALLDQVTLNAQIRHEIAQDGGEDYIVTTLPAAAPRLTYVSILPKNYFYARYQSLHRLVSVTLCVCVTLGAAMIWYVLRRNYRPLQKLMAHLETGGESFDGDALPSEYGLIGSRYARLQTQNYEYLLLLRRKNELLEQNFLYQWLTGAFYGLSDKQLLEKAAQCGAHLQAGAVLLACVKLPAETAPIPEGLYADVFENLLTELAEPLGVCAYASIRGRLICTLCLGTPREPSEVRTVFDRVGGVLTDRFQICPQVVFSQIYPNLSDAPMAFLEVAGQEKAAPYTYHYTNEDENQLTNYLYTGDADSLCRLIGCIFDKNLAQNTFPPQMVRCLAMDMGAAMMKSALARDAGFNTGIVELLSRCDDAQAMRAALEKVGRELCQQIQVRAPAAEENGNAELADRVTAYCLEHYANPDLNVNFLGDVFDRHPVYLSSQFRSRAGVRLSDFIRGLRVDHAKALLTSTVKSVREIAVASGFSDSSAMIRVFKSVEGITPNEYRQARREK